MSVFDDLLKTKHYQKLLDELPDDERKELVKALKQFVDAFENNILKPLENIKK